LSSIVTRYSDINRPATVFAFLDENQYTIEDGVYLLFSRPTRPGKMRLDATTRNESFLCRRPLRTLALACSQIDERLEPLPRPGR